jgi:hypothetical protein
MRYLSPVVTALVLVIATSAFAQTNQISDLSFPAISRQNKPWTRWWWLGSAVDEKNLTRELELIQKAGLGGVEITPIYGAAGAESRYINFLTPKWVSMLAHTGKEAARLDLGVDMATGTGWPFGGPMIEGANADAMVVRENGKLVSKPTGMKVKRAAPGDEGLVLNPYSIKALDLYLKWFDALDTLPKGTVGSQFHDSFEYSGNWSDELPDQFIKEHGYDLRDHVNELFGDGDPDIVSRVKSDYRETLGNMHYAFVERWVKWCHDHGYSAREQAHGAPTNLLDLYALGDIPETEIFGSTPFPIPGFRRELLDVTMEVPNPVVERFASSAAHVTGKPLASSETLTWLRDHFKVSLSMAKPEIDQLFLVGINRIFFHGTCYSPDDAAWPGWLFYASTEVNPRDTLWRDLPAMNAYIARCQSILQSGWPDNDVLLYWPIYDHLSTTTGMEVRFTVHNGPAWIDRTPVLNASRKLSELGVGHDLISDQQLQQCIAESGAVRVSGGSRYRAIVVPQTSRMPEQTLEKLISLAQSGASILIAGNLPEDVPGLTSLEQRRTRFKAALSQINLSDSSVPGLRSTKIGRGQILAGASIDALLKLANVPRETWVGGGIDFIRRTHADGHHYFIADLGSRALNDWVPLAVACESAVILDPLTGTSGVAATRKNAQGATEVYLHLLPGESIILRTCTTKKVQGKAWQYAVPSGPAVELSGQWNVEFVEGGPRMPASFNTASLESWTKLGDANARTFAGTARYRLRFDRPIGIAANTPLVLDLGDVRETARVKLNGTDLGTAWSVPFRLSLDGAALRDTGNVLEVEVTNLAANRIRDLDQRGVNWRIFKEINYVNIAYQTFDASNWPLAPSGLLGPVRLIPVDEGN